MKRNFQIACVLVIVMVIALIGYGIYLNYAGESTIMDRVAKRAVPVQVSTVAERTIKAQYLMKETTVEASHAFDVLAKAEGVIISDFLNKNKRVKAGEVLFELRNEEIPLKIISANSALKRAQASLKQAQNSFNRYSRLMEQDATSMEKMDEARANYEASMAAMEDAQAQCDQAKLMQSRLQVTSPDAGVVVMIYKQQGSYVTMGTPLCMVADYDRLWFAANLKEHDVQALLGKQGIGSTFTLTAPALDKDKAYNTEYGAGNRGEESSFTVTVKGVYPDLAQPAAMRRVVFDLENSAGILEPRSYVYMCLTANEGCQRLTVPVKALRGYNADDNHMLLYVVRDDNTLERREVEVGARSDKYAEILLGVRAGEKVVTSDTTGLVDGQKIEVTSLEEG